MCGAVPFAELHVLGLPHWPWGSGDPNPWHGVCAWGGGGQGYFNYPCSISESHPSCYSAAKGWAAPDPHVSTPGPAAISGERALPSTALPSSLHEAIRGLAPTGLRKWGPALGLDKERGQQGRDNYSHVPLTLGMEGRPGELPCFAHRQLPSRDGFTGCPSRQQHRAMLESPAAGTEFMGNARDFGV